MRLTRTTARVFQAGEVRSWCVLPRWCGGALLVPVATHVLVDATGLKRQDLAGVLLTVRADLAARLETDLQLRDWRPAREAAAAQPRGNWPNRALIDVQ